MRPFGVAKRVSPSLSVFFKNTPMIRTLALLLPALIPSWRFFSMIAPSPRIEFAVLGSPDGTPEQWREFRPRPDRVTLPAMLGRLFWNPRWNETLFLVTCSERFLRSGSEKSLREILSRIRADLLRSNSGQDAARYFQIRIVVVSRDDDAVMREEAYRSAVQPLNAGASA